MFGNNTSGGFGTSNTSGNREKKYVDPLPLRLINCVPFTKVEILKKQISILVTGKELLGYRLQI